jgi:5'-3' exoribonuclease 1
MGVPKFYRWLSERYPTINQVVSSSTSPEFDCLYLDMNGIIHNCSYGDGSEGTVIEGHAVMSEEQIFTSIFKYIDKLVKLVKPQRLLYMALDGVAPRAKMNQQRQRRFRSAMDRLEAQRHAAEMNAGNVNVDTSHQHTHTFDSNCITPGTEFMSKLSENLIYFVRRKIKEDMNWQRMKVIFSGSEVPGEGMYSISNRIESLSYI